MLTATITITGNQVSDLQIAIEEASRLIQEGYTSGSNENDTGSYEFEVAGDATVFVIQSNHKGNWEPVPEGEFDYLDEAREAMEELESNLGWRNLRIVSDDDVIEYGQEAEEDEEA